MRLTLLNQFYAPDISPTAQLAASLAEHRAARGDEVTVLAGRGGYLEGIVPASAPAAGDGEGGRVRVHRTWTPDVGRASVPRRLVGYVSYLVGTLVRVLLLPRQDVIVAMTTPPLVVVIALAHRLLHRRTRVVLWSMDCYPDAAERFGKLRPGGLPSRALRAVNRLAFRRLAHVVALDGAMAELLRAQYAAGPDRPTVSVVPNWERASLFAGQPPAGRWAGYDDPAVGDRTVVAYLGNLGIGHQFGTVLDAAERLADEAAFVFVGGGARRADLEHAVAARHLGNVHVHDYVTKAETRLVMAGAHGALITLDDRSLGIMSPSKLHANLAAGLPVLYVGPAGSNVDEAIERFGCGISLREGDVDGVVAAVRSLRTDVAMREKARAAFDAAYNDAVTLPQLDAILDL